MPVAFKNAVKKLIHAHVEEVEETAASERSALDVRINVHKLMIDRNETYIKFPIFQGGPDILQNAAYGAIVNEGFRNGGRPMLIRRNQFLLD